MKQNLKQLQMTAECKLDGIDEKKKLPMQDNLKKQIKIYMYIRCDL